YDGVGWYFEWNGENRMIEARNYADIMNPSSGAVRLTFTYDYQGRRVEKTVEEYDVPLASMQTVSEERFIYDGWNLIATFSSQVSGLSHQATYLWGQDLSGSMQGAGGVGGLLSVLDKSSSDVFYPTYDANGNVSEYLDETGAIAAHYEYSSFGRVIASTGAPDDFAFRFSTKYQDNETDLLYYGFRYYNPETGRWPSRDPIGERGGLNLYGFVGNAGVDRWDYLGQLDLGPWTWEPKIKLIVATVTVKFRFTASFNYETGKSKAECPDEWPSNVKFDWDISLDERDQRVGFDAWAGLKGDNLNAIGRITGGVQWEGKSWWKKFWNAGFYFGSEQDVSASFQTYISKEITISGQTFKACSCVSGSIDQTVGVETDFHIVPTGLAIVTAGISAYVSNIGKVVVVTGKLAGAR
ncbi:RHS repeat-associated core domain-containing protein, partial [Puniceicoccus vermicola]